VRTGARDPFAAAVFGLALLVYLVTLHPDIAGGDSGELIGAVGGGGVIHPPGYPAYSLLGQVFAHLPFGNLAWRLNLMSAVCDAGAAAILYLATFVATRSRGGALAAAALFAFSPGIWRYAVCAEVFALNNLLVALLFYLALAYEETREPRFAVSGAFVLGLGLSNHHTVLFTAVPLAAWVLWVGGGHLLDRRTLGLLVLALAAGLLPYLYLPLAAARHAPVTWGAANTWSGFWTHVLRREYGTFQLAPTGVAGPGPTGMETLAAWADDALEEVGWVGVLLALSGLSATVRDRMPSSKEPDGPKAPLVAIAPVLLSVGVMVTLGNLPVGDSLHRGIVARFWQQPTIFLCFWCGVGLAAASLRLGRRFEWAGAVVIALGALTLRFRAMDRSGSTLVRQYGVEYLRAAPPGALLFTKGDLITNTVRYLQLADGMRPDVRVVDQELLGMAWMAPEARRMYPEVVLPGARYAPGAPDGYAMKDLLDANFGKAPILVCGGVKAGDQSADSTYGQWPFGFCEAMHSGTEPVNLDEWIKASEEALPRIDFTGQPHPKGSWEDIVWSDYWEVRQSRAAHLITVAGRDEARRRYIALAADILQGIVNENPHVPVHVYKNLAVALGRSGLDTPDRRARAADAWQHWLDGTPKSDPQRPAIEQEVRRLRSATP
jgi:hypothetical protein